MRPSKILIFCLLGRFSILFNVFVVIIVSESANNDEIMIPNPSTKHLFPNVSTSVRIFGPAEVRHTTMGTLSGL